MPLIFKNAGELNDPVKINKALNTEFDNVRDENLKSISDVTGKFNLITSVISSAANVPKTLADGHFIVEHNDTNKRIILKTGGKTFYANLTELT